MPVTTAQTLETEIYAGAWLLSSLGMFYSVRILLDVVPPTVREVVLVVGAAWLLILLSVARRVIE